MLSPEAVQFHADLQAYVQRFGQSAGATLEEQRSISQGFSAFTAPPTGVQWSERVVGGVHAVAARPVRAGRPTPLVLYVHGGGFVFGSADGYRNFTGHVALAGQCEVLSLDYRRAPEHVFPAALDDCVAAYTALVDEGRAAATIVIGGDSAGGGVALSTALRLRDEGLPLPAGVLLFSPWTDLEVSGASMKTATGDLLASAEGMAPLAQLYAESADLRHPYLSPLHGDFSGLTPIYLVVSADEALYDDSVRTCRAAVDAGVDAQLDAVPGMQHVFPIAAGRVPEANEALRRAGAFLRRIFNS